MLFKKINKYSSKWGLRIAFKIQNLVGSRVEIQSVNKGLLGN